MVILAFRTAVLAISAFFRCLAAVFGQPANLAEHFPPGPCHGSGNCCQAAFFAARRAFFAARQPFFAVSANRGTTPYYTLGPYLAPGPRGVIGTGEGHCFFFFPGEA